MTESGLNVKLHDDLAQSAFMALLASATTRSLFIDGRRAYSTTSGKGITTFIQLPPGEHEVVFESKFRTAAVVIGVPWGTWREECSFELEEGERGGLEIKLGSNEPHISLSGVSNTDCAVVEKTGFFGVGGSPK